MYAAVASDRLPAVGAGVGAGGCLLVAIGLARRRAVVLPLGLAGVGAAYAVYLALRTGGADPRAPFVAAAIFAAAEFAFWSVAASEGLVVRRLSLLAAAVLAAAFLGSMLLWLAADSSGGVGLEAAGAAAAVLTLVVVAALAGRATKPQPKPEL